MRTYVLMLVVLGLGIMVVASALTSAVLAEVRRRELRRKSAYSAAVRMRVRFGAKAEAAVAKRLGKKDLSPRKRRFFKLVAAELKSTTASAPRRPIAPNEGQLKDAPMSANDAVYD